MQHFSGRLLITLKKKSSVCPSRQLPWAFHRQDSREVFKKFWNLAW